MARGLSLAVAPIRLLPLIALSACFTPPSTTVGSFKDKDPDRPTVAQLIDHVECEIVTAYYPHREDPVWHRLIDDHFTASIDLNLELTQTQGVNETLSWVAPKTYNGQPLHIFAPTITPFANAMEPNVPYSATLAVGLQANGTQDSQFDVQHPLNLDALLADQSLEQRNQTCEAGYKPKVSGEWVGDLKGTLGLKDTLRNGVQALDESSNSFLAPASDYIQIGSTGPTYTIGGRPVYIDPGLQIHVPGKIWSASVNIIHPSPSDELQVDSIRRTSRTGFISAFPTIQQSMS
jgi:hypothetical protein